MMLKRMLALVPSYLIRYYQRYNAWGETEDIT